MSSPREDPAVMRFAVESRDWELVGVLAEFLEREPASWLGVAQSAYLTLSVRLGLGSEGQ